MVASAYSCQDGGSGVASCVGPFPSGDAFTTASVGTHTFTVNAVDQVGNSTSRSIPYSVTYNICPLYDQTMAFASGDLVPIKLQLCDAGGVNVSAQTIVLTAIRLVQVSGSATAEVQAGGKGTPDNNFRYDASRTRYHFLLNSAGLATGTWRLEFTATGDGVTHAVQFQIR